MGWVMVVYPILYIILVSSSSFSSIRRALTHPPKYGVLKHSDLYNNKKNSN